MSELKLYRQKPVLVSAIRWDGTPEVTATILKKFHRHVSYVPTQTVTQDGASVKLPAHLTITNEYINKEGKKVKHTQIARKGDFVIQGQDDVVFPATVEVFTENYEEYEQ